MKFQPQAFIQDNSDSRGKVQAPDRIADRNPVGARRVPVENLGGNALGFGSEHQKKAICAWKIPEELFPAFGDQRHLVGLRG